MKQTRRQFVSAKAWVQVQMGQMVTVAHVSSVGLHSPILSAMTQNSDNKKLGRRMKHYLGSLDPSWSHHHVIPPAHRNCSTFFVLLSWWCKNKLIRLWAMWTEGNSLQVTAINNVYEFVPILSVLRLCGHETNSSAGRFSRMSMPGFDVVFCVATEQSLIGQIKKIPLTQLFRWWDWMNMGSCGLRQDLPSLINRIISVVLFQSTVYGIWETYHAPGQWL